MSDEPPVEEEEDDQAWLATFADLMSLLMCFFVLLLSFSEMDLEKYRQIAGSLRTAFGVQRQVKAHEPPKGTSFIAQEFTPGRPVQIPVDITKQEGDKANGENEDTKDAKIAETIEKLSELLAPEIESGTIEMVTIEGEVVVRIREGDTFDSGSARLQKSFHPILQRLVDGLDENSGKLVVAGHTDNVPIATRAYPSNWVLSSARAASVVHHLSEIGEFQPGQIEMRAYADTRPLADNALPENRARNRRVEIIVSFADALTSPPEDGAPSGLGDPVIGALPQEPGSAAALDGELPEQLPANETPVAAPAVAPPAPAPAPAAAAAVPVSPRPAAPAAVPVLPLSVQPPPPLEIEPAADEPEIRIDSE